MFPTNILNSIFFLAFLQPSYLSHHFLLAEACELQLAKQYSFESFKKVSQES